MQTTTKSAITKNFLVKRTIFNESKSFLKKNLLMTTSKIMHHYNITMKKRLSLRRAPDPSGSFYDGSHTFFLVKVCGSGRPENFSF